MSQETFEKRTRNPRRDQCRLFGVGTNDADYLVSYISEGTRLTCPIYATWRNMLARCYSKACHKANPTYSGCSVCVPWLTFSAFSSWMVCQTWRGMQLDKDLKVRGNKVYSPDLCLFLPKSLNCLITNRSLDRGDYPLGVTLHKQSGTYRAQCSVGGGGQVTLGNHKTPEEASLTYREFKSQHMFEIAQKYPVEGEIHKALVRYAKGVKDGI